MESYRFEGVMTALTSIIHSGGQTFGIETKLRRERFVQPDGSVEEVPVISGNGLRGMLRDCGMLHMCRALGYGVFEGANGPAVEGLSLPAFHFLFSGGALTSDGGKGLDISLARRLRTLIPLVGVFGGAVGNQILPGRLKVGKAIPLCRETSHLLPERYATNVSIWEYLQTEMYTRKDDSGNERLRHLMPPHTLQLLDAQRASSKARNERGDPDPEVGAHQQMMYHVESFAAGTRFFWELFLDDATDIEFEALIAALAEWSKAPYIGGRSAVGLGKVAVNFDRWFRVEPRIDLDASGVAVDVPLGARYLAHLRAEGPAIREYLRGLT